MQNLKDKLLIDFMIKTLNVPQETVEEGQSNFLPVGGLLMLVCFFLIRRKYFDPSHIAYMEEIEHLKAAMDLEEEKRKEWFREKYEILKIASGLSQSNFSIIDAYLYPKIGATLKDSIEALNNFGRNNLSPTI